jgi:AraC-like DNA-binding protein
MIRTNQSFIFAVSGFKNSDCVNFEHHGALRITTDHSYSVIEPLSQTRTAAEDNFGHGRILDVGDALGRLDGVRQQGVMRSIEFMVRNHGEPMEVARLAAVANTCPSHFFAVFKKVTGYSPMEFFIRFRMRLACRLLDTNRLAVKEVAAALGYDDPFYFSRVFKSVNGMAPSDYRAAEPTFREETRNSALPLHNGVGMMLHNLEQQLESNPPFAIR